MKKEQDTNILKALKRRSFQKSLPFHMPGHKRNKSLAPYLKDLPVEYDITEIPGFDNLNDPKEIILSTMEKANKLWKSKETLLSVNGSTSCILAGMHACLNKEDKIILGRNCHKSVYNGIRLLDLKPVYFTPTFSKDTQILGSICVKDLEDLIEQNKDAKMILLTSPTYDGVLSHIKSIQALADKHKMILMVDQAHGAHLDLSPNFPLGANSFKADIVVQSLHKTLPSMTQTSLIHINSNKVSLKRLKEYMATFQSSSPSYILISSIASCIDYLYHNKDLLFNKWIKNLDYIKDQLQDLSHLQAIFHEDKQDYDHIFAYDQAKLLINLNKIDISGKELFDLLIEKYNIYPEMYTNEYVLLILSLADKKKSLKKLTKALLEIDKTNGPSKKESFHPLEDFTIPKQVLSINEAKKKESKYVTMDKSIDQICAQSLWAFPPQIPLILPGEKISQDFINYLNHLENSQVTISSEDDYKKGYILVCDL